VEKLKEARDAVLRYLGIRQTAYKLLFNKNSPVAQEVLADLATYCRAYETCVIPGDRDKTLVLEGRREVFLRITQHLGLTVEDLYHLYGGPKSGSIT
jgi:hypothetical protein